MNRRDWLKLLAAGAPAALLASHRAGWARDDVYLVVTDDPEPVVASILKTIGRSARVHQRPVAPSPQDLTIIREGAVIDPRIADGVDRPTRDLIAYLRSKRTPGTRLVTIDQGPREKSHRVYFEHDGQIVESVDRRKSYQRIVVPGTQGSTEFSLMEGKLRVIRSSCRHELCRRSGSIRSGRIVCVPNRLVASIDGSARMFDAITG